MKLILLKIILICCVHTIQSYKILGVFPSSAYSHFTLGFRLMKELADKGHEVVFINSRPEKQPIKNFRYVSVEETKDAIKPMINMAFLSHFGQNSYIKQLFSAMSFSKTLTSTVLNNVNVQNLMKSNEKFDLVILEQFLNEAMVIFAHKFQCPLIYLAPGPTTVRNNYLFGNPAPPSYVTNLLSNYNTNMTFWQRLDSTYSRIVEELFMHFYELPMQNQILKDAFPDAPDLSTILYNASLMLTTSHVGLGHPVPLQQNIKEVGGYFISPSKPLPKEIQEFMDNSTEGVVVFSMGSNLKSAEFDSGKLNSILKAFSNIKQKVLWKFEEDLPEKPSNVKILKWLPQSDVLAHPNTVAFISHCGLLGTTEAVYHGVPILGVPIFWDQFRNIQNVVQKGLAIKIAYENLEGEEFKEALNELLNNSKYRQAAKKYSLIMRDNPIQPIDEAVFWIEYVIRHKGAPHLRSAAVDLKWYQLYLVDIILFVGTIIAVIFSSLYLILSCVCGRKKVVDEKKKNK